LIRKAQRSVWSVKNALIRVKEYIRNYNFCETEEIKFFKETKPLLFSKLIYFVRIFNIESRRPEGSREMQEIYLRRELEKLTNFFNNHLEFYQYYRMNSTHLDDKYFLRGKENYHFYQDCLMFYADEEYSTSHDYMVSKIIANDLLEVYLNSELEGLSIRSANPNWGQIGLPEQRLLWTENKTSLVELIYALYASGVINRGNCEIRELAALFEQAFNVRLTDIYRTFLEIKIRSNPTKFIDSLKTSLLRKMEDEY